MGVTVGNGCKIENASFGKNVEIEAFGLGDNVSIKNVRVGDNVIIGNNCRLRSCFIDDNIIIGHDCTVLAKTFIGEGVVIPNNSNLIDGGILVKDVPEEEDYGVDAERDSHYEVRFKHRTGFWKNSNLERRRARTYSNADHACDQTLDKLEVENEETDVMRFFNEVFDSMSQAVENMDSAEHRTSNLILEINSSKLAYNMTMEDVAKNVFLAFLKLECCSELAQIKTLMQDWHHVFTNYYTPHKNQIQLLLALEEHCQTHPEIFKIANHIVHHLYSDCDILQEEAIFEWFKSLNTDSAMYAKIKPIIDWLEQSSDEEEESDKE
ncbi:hypothetical protein L596_018450 [Steinernema carpocapsae]|uniref:W2 domain-containing protein n=1 Tax=Steinernema carpocapsae TaxID=34508 RepID=A0A4U5N5H1_STECR|nr:hypothetical protein L596_018450 [Steinernema carpocapsae]